MNEMKSFGDDTISACIKTEDKNNEIFKDDTDVQKCFKDRTLVLKAKYKSDETNNISYLKRNRTTDNLNNVKEASYKEKPNTLESNKEKATISKIKVKQDIQFRSSRLKLKKVDYIKRYNESYKGNKENITANYIMTQNKSQSNRSVSLKQSNEFKYSTIKSNSHATTVNNSQLSGSSTSKNEEKSIDSTRSISIIPTQDRCKLASWGLPQTILQKYEARGVFDMFPWQVECLSNYRVIDERRNLVYSAPTSAGKTLVAEILIIKTVLERRKKAIFILPFVSVVREKMYYFQDLLFDSGVRVEGFMGSVVPAGGFAATQIAIATIEKANSLVNRLMEENELVNLGVVVIDELHLVGDPNRGYLLELLLTKLKYMTLRDERINIQLIGMSATLPNLSILAEWLDAELYKTEFRPIPLNEQCKIGMSIYDNKLNLVRELMPVPELITDTDNIIQLCIETISDGHSVLIFCPTKNWCEKLAEQIATTFFKLGREDTHIGQTLRQQLDPVLISETLEQLKRSPIGLDNVLKNTVSFGIAFHHAGLTMDERDIIEGSFRSGSLRVLIATSTLSSGVNLPARRVIVRSPMFGGRVLDSFTYRQMIGRAGRMGKDTAGESILICKPNERKAAESLLFSTLDPIESCLEDSAPLIRALLEAIASEVVFTPSDLELYTKCTLVSLTDESNERNSTQEAIKFLIDNEFLLLQKAGEEQRWVATALGKACLASSVPPKEGLFLLEELQKARRCFVLDTELHVVYLVTPLNSGSQISTIDWMTFLELWKMLSESERRVGQLVGVEERFLASAIKGIVRPGKSLSVHRRFYTALALHDLVREVPLNAVCKKYGCCRGVLQSLQQSAATFAGMVTQFCKQLGWNCMELLVSQFQTRLQFGVCRELLDLLRLPMLNGLRARSLYKHGITCIADLAIADELDVERALHKALPFESEKEQDGEHETETIKRNKMRTVFVTGRDGLTPHEAAVMLVQEARALVQNELRLQNLSWKQNEQCSMSNESSVHTSLQTMESTVESTKSTMPKTNSEVLSRDTLTSHKSDINSMTYGQTELQNSSIKHNKEEESVADSINHAHEKSKNVRNVSSSSLNHDFNIPNQIEKSGNEINVKPTDQTLRLSLFDTMGSPTEKQSFDVFDESGSMLRNDKENRRDSESLISFKDVKTHRIQTSTLQHTISNVQNTEEVGETPTKELKPSDTGEMEILNVPHENKITHTSNVENSRQIRISRSPSLFDDSLTLDTQMYNVLEENIDALHFSEFEESKLTESNILRTSTQKKIVDFATDNNEKVCSTDYVKEKDTPKCPSPEFTEKINTQTKQSIYSWKDDSWNEPKVILDKVALMNSKEITGTPNKHNIRNIKNVNIPHVLGTPGTSNYTPKKKYNTECEKSISVSGELTKISQKRRFKEIPTEKSPIASVVFFGKNRGVSVDSNKSDSDDIIVASQHTNSPAASIKVQSKLDSEKRQRILTQKISNYLSGYGKEHINVNTISNVTENTSKKNKPQLNEVLVQNVISRSGYSIDSIISNSDEDSPIRSVKALQKANVCSKKVKIDSETCLQPSKSKVNANKTNLKALNIIKVGSDRSTFNLFKREVMNRQYIALALNCEAYTDNVNSIGSKIVSATNVERKKRSKKMENYIHANRKLCGVSISWESNIAYYMSFSNIQESKVTSKEQMKLLKEILSNVSLNVKCFATKEVYKTLYHCCGILGNCNFLDPKVANWLYGNSVDENTFNELVAEHFPDGTCISQRVGPCYDTGPGLNTKSSVLGELRASAEAILTWHITNVLLYKLEKLDQQLLYTFREIEMKAVTILACMELTGLGVCFKSLQDLSSVIREEMTSLENRAYSSCGKKFNFSSSKEVGEVLGLYKGKKISVNKAVLEHSDHPISSLIMSWRKLNLTQSKIINPLLNLTQHESRIHGNCLTCTLTGRISMHEPNLQNVPKDFNSEDNSFIISVRMAFVPAIGNVMLSADYCQLELRILAHFSKDPTLCDIMKKPGDIFKSIAAKWNCIPEEKVDDTMRQHVKQLCYGMIYGMGIKTLAESLSVEETEAKEFLESFMNTYPNIRKWLNFVVEEAHANGYVTTLFGRRRVLPGLCSTKPSEKSQAERQAVNTKVQGSAADIAKKAMIKTEEKLRYEFSNSAKVLPTVQIKRKLRSNSREAQQRGGYLVLQLHDELLYEVNIKDVQQVAAIVKESMEQVCDLEVPLPIKIKVGPAWGDLTEYNCTN